MTRYQITSSTYRKLDALFRAHMAGRLDSDAIERKESMAQPTAKQVEYLTSLIHDLKLPVAYLATYDTFDKASMGIDRLQARLDRETPIKAATRAAVFARLKQTSYAKADMYAGAGIETLSARPDGTGATEADAKRCLRFLDGTLRRPEPNPAAPEAVLLGDVADWLVSQMAAPTVAPPAPQMRIIPGRGSRPIAAPVHVPPIASDPETTWQEKRDLRLAAGDDWDETLAIQEALQRFPEKWNAIGGAPINDILGWIGYDAKKNRWHEVIDVTEAA